MPPRLRNVMVLALGAWLGLTGSAMAGAFTPGNLVVLAADTNASPNKAVGIKLAEYTTAGFLVQTITIGSSGGTGTRLTQSVSEKAEGYLSRSADGKYLTFAGYDADAGTSGVNTTSTTGLTPVLRVVGKADFNGTVTLGTNTTSYSGGQIHTAATANGSSYWTGGNAAVDHGLRTIADGAAGVAAAKVNEALDVISLQVFNNQLYGSTDTTIFQTNTALPTGESATTSLVTSLKNATGFSFLDRTKDGILDTLYIASQKDGLLKYQYNGTIWEPAAGAFKNIKEGTLSSVAAAVDGTNVNLYLTTSNGTIAGNRLLKLIDDGSVFDNLTYTLLATADANTSFRSVDFAPDSTASVPEPASLLLVGLAAAGGVLFRLRHRGARADKTP